MGLFGKGKKASKVVIEADDLALPDMIETDIPGLTLRKVTEGARVDLEIVGESFRQDVITAVAEASAGDWFDIYLQPEMGNPYDKNAVRVMVGSHHVAYVSKATNRKWRKAHQEALERGELLGGRAKAVSRSGSMYGVFGYVWMPMQPPAWKPPTEPQQVPIGILTAALVKLGQLEPTRQPTSVSQVATLIKKAGKAAEPLVAHCRWVQDSDLGEESKEAWDQVESWLRDLADAADQVAYISDPDDIDIGAIINEISAALEDALKVEPAGP